MKASFCTLQQLGLFSLLATVAVSEDDLVMPECWKKCVHKISTRCQSLAVERDCLCYFDDKIDHRVFECLDAECEAPSDVVDFRGLIDECKFDRWPSPSTSSIAAKATRTLVVSDDIIRETAVTSTVRATVTLDPTMDHSDAGSVTSQVDPSLFLESSTFSQPTESLPAATSSVGSTERASTDGGTILDLAGLGSTTEAGSLLGLTAVILAGIAWF